METEIDRDARAILTLLASKPRGELIWASDIASELDLTPGRLNDAMRRLVDASQTEWIQESNPPFDFIAAEITSRGRYEVQRLSTAKRDPEVSVRESVPMLPPVPIGSPYGFTPEDWEFVSLRKSRTTRLYVVLGHQFESAHYDTMVIRANVKEMFKSALAIYCNTSPRTEVKLEFKALAAGYGEHLFNQIARDIIAADVAVFDTSDLNANVMLEMGVALTWGVRVLPIKEHSCPRPPSDVSGQTWADYRDSAAAFLDPDHEDKLVTLIDLALRRKASRYVGSGGTLSN